MLLNISFLVNINEVTNNSSIEVRETVFPLLFVLSISVGPCFKWLRHLRGNGMQVLASHLTSHAYLDLIPKILHLLLPLLFPSRNLLHNCSSRKRPPRMHVIEHNGISTPLAVSFSKVFFLPQISSAL